MVCSSVSYSVTGCWRPGANLGGAVITHAASTGGVVPSGNLTSAETGPSATSSYHSSWLAKSLGSVSRLLPVGDSALPRPPSTTSRPCSSVKIVPSCTETWLPNNVLLTMTSTARPEAFDAARSGNAAFAPLTCLLPPSKLSCSRSLILVFLNCGGSSLRPNHSADALVFARCTFHVICASLAVTSPS